MNNLLNIIFPLKCINCGQPGEIICDNCLYDCELLTTQYCIVCDRPSFDGYTHKECGLKKRNQSPTQVISIYAYKDTVRDCIKTSKYGSKQFISLKKLIYSGIEILKEWNFDFKDHICISIPSSKKKYKKRGFNQSEILTEIVAKQLHLETQNSFINRVKETQAQYTLDKKERFENLKKAFAINDNSYEYLKDKKVLLIDDVVTTGATLLEATKILYECGVQEVKCLTLSKKFKKQKHPG